MTDVITVIGIVGSDPRAIVTDQQQLTITSFRLASTRRYFDRAKGTWENGDTNWYTVSAFRTLAENVIASVHKGERVIVRGRLKLREWQAGERSGTAIEIEADSIGHDLNWGISNFRRVPAPARQTAATSDEAATDSDGRATGDVAEGAEERDLETPGSDVVEGDARTAFLEDLFEEPDSDDSDTDLAEAQPDSEPEFAASAR